MAAGLCTTAPHAPVDHGITKARLTGHPQHLHTGKVATFNATYPYTCVIDPMDLVGHELRELKQNIGKLLACRDPSLNSVLQYAFHDEGKLTCPMLVLLMAQATSVTNKENAYLIHADYRFLDQRISRGFERGGDEAAFHQQTYYPYYRASVAYDGCIILPSQRRLAEIAEIIHVASLLHDDVIDGSDTRRHRQSVNARFGNKSAILAGDFLITRASMAMARLGYPACTELMAGCLVDLVEGEWMQLQDATTDERDSDALSREAVFDRYLERIYKKTASLVANSCQASALLGGAAIETVTMAYEFGRHLGIAYQLLDDTLDFSVSHADLGKPVGADLKLGLATAPVLFAWEEFPELGPLIARRFSQEGDIEMAQCLVLRSNGVKKSLALARKHSMLAIAAISKLPSSGACSALIHWTEKLMKRTL
ncbi:coq1 putative hexaprenyl diphosphate synthase [Apophysomyces ossiformis]|uniref:Coq1 putative hexaprenyl diphosphate synthase n=1 Tax=Apophysomyces ossiformis TaxID=679940 RepID=A0A8H7BKV6_9FUNG|nr:coq1 putative hexaprenyl diphosphate synthase [Apophysomyces ossiformis]